jgi:hypothetical protein
MDDPIIPSPIKQSQLQSFPHAQHKNPVGGQEATKPRTSTDIIRDSLRHELPPGSDVESYLKVVGMLVQRKAVQLLQLGNTVFMLTPKGPGAVEFHTFTTENPQNLVARYKSAINSLKQMGIKKAYSYASSPAFVRIAQSTGVPVKVSQTTKDVGGKMMPVYQFEVDL